MLNKSLRRYLTSLLLFFVFAAVRTGYGQTTDYAALRSAGRVEHWAGHFDSDLVDAQILSNLGAIFQRQHKYGKAEESYKWDAIVRSKVNIGAASPSWSK